MEQLGAAALPVLVGVILLFGFVRDVPVFDVFLQGAREGIRTSLKLLPTLIGLVAAVVAGYFHMVVSLTILACVFALAIVCAGLKLYYFKKF